MAVRKSGKSFSVTGARDKASAAYEKFSANTPGASTAQKRSLSQGRVKAKPSGGVGSVPTSRVKPTSKPVTGSVSRSTPKPAGGSVSRPAAKSPAELSAARTRIKALAEQGYQRYVAKNPGASRADYSAYARGRVKEMAARARARKRGA